MNVHTVSTTYKSEGGSVTIKTETIQGDLSTNIEVEIPAGATNVEIDVAIPITTLKGFAFGCSKKTGDPGVLNSMYIETNNSTAGANNFTITPSNGISWSEGDPTPLPITTAITKLFVTSNGTAIGNFIGRALVDATP